MSDVDVSDVSGCYGRKTEQTERGEALQASAFILSKSSVDYVLPL